MRTTTVTAAAFGLLLLAGVAPQDQTGTGGHTGTGGPPPKAATAPAKPAPAPAVAPSTSNCLAPPFLIKTGANAYVTPKDFAALPRQPDANCLAWQEFISLNWVASSTMRGQPDTSVTPQAWGTPNDTRPVVWETYKESNEVFLPNATPPPAWNTWPGGAAAKSLGGMKSEVDGEPTLDLSDIGQASTGHPWLTAQSGILTLYERRLNQDEFNYIVNNKLYNANQQQVYVTVHPVPPPSSTSGTVPPLPPVGISLPDGTAATAGYGPLGAIETKAAWIELPNSADWPRYKTSKATVTYPGQKPKAVTVGLVGLHIIHKTALGQQFIWATFEHVDNCPDATQVANKTANGRYTYYNPKCDPKTDAYQCKVNANPSTYKPPKPYTAPQQIVRNTPTPTRANNNVAGLNQYVWNQIKAANPKSVFLHYELVNTLWSNQNTTIAPGARTPLFAGQLSPAATQEPVTNTTLETYVQNLTCLTCHASAPVATTPTPSTTKIFQLGSTPTGLNPYASDYSFLFDNATVPKK
jgi:hypothetical protein